ncbi:UNVERIFIED_CONTAM: hypothetical protein FKN15_012690 [Acipenser sinensis]
MAGHQAVTQIQRYKILVLSFPQDVTFLCKELVQRAETTGTNSRDHRHKEQRPQAQRTETTGTKNRDHRHKEQRPQAQRTETTGTKNRDHRHKEQRPQRPQEQRAETTGTKNRDHRDHRHKEQTMGTNSRDHRHKEQRPQAQRAKTTGTKSKDHRHKEQRPQAQRAETTGTKNRQQAQRAKTTGTKNRDHRHKEQRPQNVLAKALYDNVAESPDELSFRKGDIMTVLERDTQGLDGWWLCSLHGRQGIAPGNRMKILVGMYDKKQEGGGQLQQQPLFPQQTPPQTPLPFHKQSSYSTPSPASQYTAMHPAFQSPMDNVYMMPPSHGKGQTQSIYQVPPGPQYQGPLRKPPLFQKQGSQQQYQSQSQSIYQVPPLLGQSQDIYQVPPGSKSPPQDVYQVPPSMNQNQDIYQIPPSMEKRSWESPKPPGKVVVPTRVGQVYVYDSGKTEQDEYDIPRQEIYDVPPNRGAPVSQYSQEVYDTPPMAVKGPNSRETVQEIYDVPPSVEKNLHSQMQSQTVYDFPPSVSKDVPDGPVREETYDVPPAFMKMKKSPEIKHYLSQVLPQGVPDDTKQLASFLHGNASLLFKRTKQQQQQAPQMPQLGDSRLSVSQAGLENVGQVTNNNISAYQTGLPEKANIQSRPLPSPPKFMAEESPDSQYENTEEGWMEDYDYVHLQATVHTGTHEQVSRYY